MLLKTGVDISRLKPPIRKKLNIIEECFNKYYVDEMVITSTYEGNHNPNSLHYANLAIDIRCPATINNFFVNLKEKLGNNFDIVFEKNHIHIEYDVK